MAHCNVQADKKDLRGAIGVGCLDGAGVMQIKVEPEGWRNQGDSTEPEVQGGRFRGQRDRLWEQ